MTGYTRQWDCLLCGEHQDTIDTPKAPVCYDCVQSLARVICKERLGVDYHSEGVDQRHWDQKAYDYVDVLFRRSRRKRKVGLS